MKARVASMASSAGVADDSVAGADQHYDASHPQLSPVLTAEISRLFSLGYSLLPLGGSDGKRPIVEFKDKKRLPLSLVVERLGAAGSESYGIRLPGLVVVDVDTDTPEARAYVERRFGSSPCRTRTGRGFHLYFRSNGRAPSPVRLPGIAIDSKSGPNAFVVGPQSERPDKVVYWPEGRLLAPEKLPLLDDREAQAHARPAGEPARSKTTGRYPQGVRWNAVKKQGATLARRSGQFSELVEGLMEFRDDQVEQPHHFTDSDIVDLARWFWDRKERGELWGEDNSFVRVPRKAIAVLAAQGHTVALTLYSVLLSAHGHRSSEIFAIVPDGLRKGPLKAGRQQIYAAINLLMSVGLLKRVTKGGKGRPARYRLGFEMTESEDDVEGSALISVLSPSTSGGPSSRRKVA